MSHFPGACLQPPQRQPPGRTQLKPPVLFPMKSHSSARVSARPQRWQATLLLYQVRTRQPLLVLVRVVLFLPTAVRERFFFGGGCSLAEVGKA